VKLQNKVAIVAGVSPNIGGGIVEELQKQGANLVCLDISRSNADAAAEYLRKNGANAIGIPCDVCDEDQVRAAVEQTTKTFGGVDILVNNAAIFNRKGVLDMPVVEWRKQIDVILTGAFLGTKYAAQSMIERRRSGSIINIISTAGHQGEPRNVAYSTAKCGLLNFTRSTAMELAGHGIRVNSVTPTATDPTEARDRAERWGRPQPDISKALVAMESFRQRIPLQRLPVSSDYGRAVAFLASDEASMITGVDLRVDAGAVARYWAWDPTMTMRSY
jgi:NAD(P)-dependent dehydrogenase (short-subunit alcohol dehydrogenase family)